MSLDVTSYQRVELVKELPRLEDYVAYDPLMDDSLDGAVLTFWQEPELAEFADGLPSGAYQIEGEMFAFRVGPYSLFNAWRNQLSIAFLGKRLEDVWDSPLERGPFVEIAQFADCGGFFGPKTSAKLAGDFRSHRSEIPGAVMLAGGLEMSDFVRIYEDFSAAFALASGAGVVHFH
jgi:hypothetical protein